MDNNPYLSLHEQTGTIVQKQVDNVGQVVATCPVKRPVQLLRVTVLGLKWGREHSVQL